MAPRARDQDRGTQPPIALGQVRKLAELHAKASVVVLSLEERADLDSSAAEAIAELNAWMVRSAPADPRAGQGRRARTARSQCRPGFGDDLLLECRRCRECRARDERAGSG
jgi:hypothetical protein